MIRFKACPKCIRGDLEWVADEDAWACIQCGCRVPVFSRLGLLLTPIPPKPALFTMNGRNTHPREFYYRANMTRIIIEAQEFGEAEVKRRWDISHVTWIDLKRRWGLPINKVGGHGRSSLLRGNHRRMGREPIYCGAT